MRRTGTGRAAAAAALAAVALGGCFSTARVTIERLDPPIADVGGIRDVAVFPFADRAGAGGSGRGEAAAARLIDVTLGTGRYRVMKPAERDTILSRDRIAFSYPPGAELVRRIGGALGVDALLYGEIEKFDFDEEQRLVRSREAVWTGEYERDRRGNPVNEMGSGGAAERRRKMRSAEVEKNRLSRSAVLVLRVTLADVFLGNVITTEAESESGIWEGTGESEISQMPSRDAVFELLLDRAVKRFVRQIAPHPVEEERLLERGMFHATNLGVELAKNILWDEAMDKWMQSTKAKPEDPAAYYNLGVGFEKKGLFDLAYKSYQNALTRNPASDRYIKAVAKLQKLMKELE